MPRSCARSSRASWSRSTSAGLRSHTFAAAEPKGCLFEYVYLARPDTAIAGRSVQAARVEVGRRLAAEHPADADLVIPVPESSTPSRDRVRAGQRHPLWPGTGQELLRRPDVHPAEPDHQGTRYPAEVQPAARGHRRQAAGCGRRLDRPRQHAARHREHAARGRGGRGARPDFQPAGRLAVLLRHRLRQPGGADGRELTDRGDQANRSVPTRSASSPWTALIEATTVRPTGCAVRVSTASTRSRWPRTRGASTCWRPSARGCRGRLDRR